MKRFITILFIISQYLLGQFPSYDLSAVDESNFVAGVEPLVRSTSFSLGYHQFSAPDLANRFYVSINTAVGNDLTGRSFIFGKINCRTTYNSWGITGNGKPKNKWNFWWVNNR